MLFAQLILNKLLATLKYCNKYFKLLKSETGLKKMLKIIDKIVLVISICVMAGLLGAYTSSYIDPNSFVVPSLLGLSYPYLLISNILLLLYWITRWKKTAWILLGVLLLGFPAFTTYYGTANTQEEEQKHDISLMSYNIRYFDIYSWSKQKNTRQKLFDYLNEFEGDIVCLQEFSLNELILKNQTIIDNLHTYPYHYLYRDMAVFSRLPIIRKGAIPFDKKQTSACIYFDVPLAGDTVRIYSVHLESYRLGKQERKFMKEMADGLKNTDITGGIKGITLRLAKANKTRAKQAEQIYEHIKTSPYEVILCGDFNDTPLSYTYKTMKGHLSDCFIEKGRGLGNTYIGEFPSFRIDYILHTPKFEAVSYNRGVISLSDHYPVMSKLKIKQP